MGSDVNGAGELLRRAQVVVAPESFTVVGLSHSDWKTLLETSNVSPRMTVPFMILMDVHEVTLILDDTDFRAIKATYSGSKFEGGYRLLTFDIVLDLSIVGFMAEVSRILADAGVAILPISAFSRDHLLVKQDQLASALKALGPFIDSVC